MTEVGAGPMTGLADEATVSVAELARHLGVSQQRVRELLRDEKIPGEQVRISGRATWKILARVLDETPPGPRRPLPAPRTASTGPARTATAAPRSPTPTAAPTADTGVGDGSAALTAENRALRRQLAELRTAHGLLLAAHRALLDSTIDDRTETLRPDTP